MTITKWDISITVSPINLKMTRRSIKSKVNIGTFSTKDI